MTGDDEQRASQHRQQLMMDEVTHRVKNTLTVVQSLARQTLHSAKSGKDFVQRVEGRLDALAAAHQLLVESNWAGAELLEVVSSQLGAYAPEGEHRLQIKGDPVVLVPEIATPFGLLLHELATNAAKYGAFSNDTGRVTLSWHLTAGNKGRHLSVVWNESGGPAVSRPERQGFGSTLIERGVPQAIVEISFEPDGLVCTIEVDLVDQNDDGEEYAR